MKKVSVFIATAGRPSYFVNMLSSLERTTKGHNIETVFVIDENYECMTVAREWSGDSSLIDYSPERRGALWAWNRGLELSTGDILVPTGDDHLFYDGWLDYALESLEKRLQGYGVVGMNDLAYDGNKQVATMFLFDRKYCKEQMGGIFAPPMYKYYCIDLEWNEKAKILGRYYWDDRSIIEHVHSAHGKRSLDEIDKSKPAEWMETDNEVFRERKANGFPVTWEPII